MQEVSGIHFGDVRRYEGKMTPKMKKFCEEYLKNGGKGNAAAKAAGYQGNDHTLRQRASALLKQDEIKEYLAGHAEEACRETQLTVQGVLEDLEWAKDAAKAGYPTKEGNRKDLTSYIKACELQGKYLKMWIDRVDVSVSGHAELMKLIQERRSNGDA